MSSLIIIITFLAHADNIKLNFTLYICRYESQLHVPRVAEVSAAVSSSELCSAAAYQPTAERVNWRTGRKH